VTDRPGDLAEEARTEMPEDPGVPSRAEQAADPDSPLAGLADALASTESAAEESPPEAAEDAVEPDPEPDPDSPFAGLAELLVAPATKEEPAEEEEEEEQPAAVEEQAEAVPGEPAAVAEEKPAAEEASDGGEPEAEAAPDEVAEEEEADEAGAPLGPSSPYDLPGSWYVIHSYSGYENKVKANIQTRIHSMHMEESIFDVVIPMEDVVEFKGGRKVTVPKKQFPGYLLVRMYLDDDSWSVTRNTPGVTGFVGSGNKPTPLSRREVERILGVRKDEEKKTPRFKPDWEIGETVRVVEGPFADFNGVIEDINVDQSKVRVLVDIFGRETPVELSFEQIQKF
jgi:transcriptional antiterminator NusG